MAGGSRSRRRPSAAHSLLLLALVALTTVGKARAATFQVTNLCSYTVWPAAIPAGGGTQLEPSETWVFKAPAGTGSGRVWGRTDCHFAASGAGLNCGSGDCAGAYNCQLSGKPPATLAEFTIGGAADFYDLSVVDGFNLPMDFSCDGAAETIRCGSPGCSDANHSPGEGKVRSCKADSDYHVVFRPK